MKTNSAKRAAFFGKDRKVIVSCAPARLDVMGGIGDYCGSLVLSMPLEPQTTIYAALNEEQLINIHDTVAEKRNLQADISVPLGVLFNSKANIEYNFARKAIQKHGEASRWALYVVGAFLVLAKEKDIQLKGCDIWVESDIPYGRGVASSAAIEVATLKALCELLEVDLGQTELPHLATMIENHFVNSPCGIMDPLSCYRGKAGSLLPIICQPDHVLKTVSVPNDVLFIGIDTAVKYTMNEGNYSLIRTAAFMGYSIIAQYLGASVGQIKRAKTTQKLDKLPYKGYLANITLEDFEAEYEKLLPAELSGEQFLDTFQATTAPIFKVEKDKVYPVQIACRTVIESNQRAKLFLEKFRLLDQLASEEADYTPELKELGELMYGSQETYKRAGFGNKNVDLIVQMIKDKGIDSGLYGARPTAGGQGGTVCVLAKGNKGFKAAREIHLAYKKQTGLDSYFFFRSGSGAIAQENKTVLSNDW